MVEISKFQQMNGCSACKHAAEKDPEGQPASQLGASFYCLHFGKPVETKDGSACPAWAYD